MAKPPYCSRTAEKFVVRLPDGVRDRIAAIASENRRSMNSEIVHRLEDSLAITESLPDDVGADLSPIERELIQSFRALGGDRRQALIAFLK